MRGSYTQKNTNDPKAVGVVGGAIHRVCTDLLMVENQVHHCSPITFYHKKDTTVSYVFFVLLRNTLVCHNSTT